MYKVEEESNLKVVIECMELGRAHYEEVDGDRNEKIGFSLNIPMFKLLVDAGVMHLVVARNNDDKIVGYFATVVSPDFFSDQFTAKEIGIYVDPKYRNTRVFKLLMNKIEAILTENGVAYNYLMFKKGHNEQLPTKLGYEKTETVYMKYLGDESWE